jgi:hypothetical protein
MIRRGMSVLISADLSFLFSRDTSMFVQMNLFEYDRELKKTIQDYFSEVQKMVFVRRNEDGYAGDRLGEATVRRLYDEGLAAYEHTVVCFPHRTTWRSP